MSISDDIQDQDPASFIRDVAASEMHFRKRVSVGILGATGSVGQRLIALLSKHPWFTVSALAASESSAGRLYKDAVQWRINTPLHPDIANLPVQQAIPNLGCDLVFSALDATVAGDIEADFAKKGYPVISCARPHRMDPNVPLVVPEVNFDHLELVKTQQYSEKGMIIAKPNCAVVGLVLALRPLQLEFGIEAIHVVTMQALSGAGFPGVPSLAVFDNIIPYIPTEAERFEIEPYKILGTLKDGSIQAYPLTISSTCSRVPISDGHLQVVSVKLKRKPSREHMIRAFKEFVPYVQELNLPSRCKTPIHYFDEEGYPQPALHRDLESGMAVSVGRLRECPILDYKFVTLSHNTIRGASGGAILLAELLIKKGYVFW